MCIICKTGKYNCVAALNSLHFITVEHYRMAYACPRNLSGNPDAFFCSTRHEYVYKAHARIIKPFKNKKIKNKLKTSTEQPGFGHSSSRVSLIPLALGQCSCTPLCYLCTYCIILLLLKTLYYSLRKTQPVGCQ